MSVTIPNTWSSIGRKLGGSKRVLRKLVTSVGVAALALATAGCKPSARHEAEPAPQKQAVTAAPSALPRVDVHLHIDLRAVRDALEILKEQNIVVGLNASGGEAGRGLELSQQVAERSKGALQPLCNVALFGFD